MLETERGTPEERRTKVWQPDYNDPKFVEYWGALIRESGRRYDGHPWLESVDLGALGFWGEWHTYTRPWMMPPLEIKRKLVDIYLESFKKTPLLMLIGGELRYATSRGTGWRADSLGPSNSSYPQRIAASDATDAWKTAPVVFEVGRTFADHLASGLDIDKTITEALRWHASSVNAKSSAIPSQWEAKFREFNNRMGYAFELRMVEYQPRVRAGAMVPMRMWWVNAGVAPPYRKFKLVILLKNEKTSGLIPIDIDMTKWLPGDDIVLDDSVFVPDLEPGKYRLQVGLLDPYSGKPAIKLPMKGRTQDNWHDLGEIEILPWKLEN